MRWTATVSELGQTCGARPTAVEADERVARPQGERRAVEELLDGEPPPSTGSAGPLEHLARVALRASVAEEDKRVGRRRLRPPERAVGGGHGSGVGVGEAQEVGALICRMPACPGADHQDAPPRDARRAGFDRRPVGKDAAQIVGLPLHRPGHLGPGRVQSLVPLRVSAAG